MNFQTDIINAIRSKCTIELNYKKEEENRVVCPHALYISPTGKTFVDAYQLAGYSTHPENIPGWRNYEVSEITTLQVLDETFEITPGYNPLSKRYLNAIAKI